jgi:hypothetical protein
MYNIKKYVITFLVIKRTKKRIQILIDQLKDQLLWIPERDIQVYQLIEDRIEFWEDRLYELNNFQIYDLIIHNHFQHVAHFCERLIEIMTP